MPVSEKCAMPLVEITFFGGFSMKIQGRIITNENGHAKQLWNFLEYLIANRYSDISQDKLIDVLWGEEGCDNPSNALKNLAYRARHLLVGLYGGNCDFIVYRRRNYCWNNDLPCKIDIEEFEEACRAASRKDAAPEKRLDAYRKVETLYKGEFLPKSSSEDWVIFRSTRYSRLYIENMYGYCGLLFGEGQYARVIEVCEKALQADEFDEPLHEMLIRAYLKAGMRQKAIQHYEYVSGLFYEKLGVKLSDGIRKLMRENMKSLSGLETDLEVIKGDLKENGQIGGAYYCEYDVFKDFYRIQARLAGRQGQSVFVSLLTVSRVSGGETDLKNNPRIAASMQTLKSVIIRSLRKSDVFTRLSNTQYMVMLPSLTYENGQMVLRRIIGRFHAESRYHDMIVTAKLNPLDPVL